MKSYDYIFAGGGAASLSLAYHLLNSPLRDRRMLIIDPDQKLVNDRTWCFWTERPTHFSSIYYRSWRKIGFRSKMYSADYDLGQMRYNLIRGIDFYQFTRSALQVQPTIDFLYAPVQQVTEAPGSVLVSAGDSTFEGSWLFDSRFRETDWTPQPERYHYLRQHFLGWEIETNEDCFDPSTPILFDFRTQQVGDMRFIYILPFEPRRALVEFTLFSPDFLQPAEYETALKKYIAEVLKINEYKITAIEKASIPMSDHPFQRKGGERILNIGTRGGRVKPSSGYAFMRIQNDSTAIVRSMEKYHHPFAIPASPARYRLFDSTLLQILKRHGDLSVDIFTRLFRDNPTSRLLGFMDETGGLLDNMRLMTTVPTLPFLRAFIKSGLLHKS